MTNRKIAIVEFNTWHGECLTPQIAYLKAHGDDITLICPRRTTSAIDKSVLDGIDITLCPEKKGMANVWHVWRILWRGGFDAIILNTAQGSECLKLCLLPKPRRSVIVGTIHNLKKLTHSFGQRHVVRRLDGILVIAPYLVPHIPPTGIPTAYYSPLPAATATSQIDKGGDRWIVVPGNVEFKRRNYGSLIDIAKAAKGRAVKFIVLGNSQKAEGPEFRKTVCEAGLDEIFIFFDSFVDSETFDAHVVAADYLLPLIDDKLPSGADYLTNKTSGTFSLSARFGKTMLCHKTLTPLAPFYPCVFYDTTEDLLSAVELGKQTTAKPLDFNEEAERYNTFIDNIISK